MRQGTSTVNEVFSRAVAMSLQVKRYAWSTLAALTLICAATGLANVIPAAAYLLLPGIYLGALFISGGAHSEFPMGYLAIAAAMNVIVWTWVILGLWMLIARLSSHNIPKGAP